MAMHDLNQVSGIADRVALLKDGGLFHLGKADEVLSPENIKAAYLTDVDAFPHPKTGKHLIFPKD
jgi:ABC-type cobalamin/Fe3+-siderophores transport system ATPase subunit